ncbi:hypothetical protein ACLOAU_16060 [Niabella sp. CJ426]|uniref:hypothetical protein n=1 Tax=Niabella sp. CJ426 TaxID=3393740 RepID=UPI003D0017E9
MDKLSKPIIWTAVILLLMTTDFSSTCRHGLKGANAFHYNTGFVQSGWGNPATGNGQSQNTAGEISWKQLADVTYVLKYNKQFDGDIMYPVFGAAVKKLAGKEWIIEGYMIPLDIKSGLYAVSRNPYAACFFCGAAGVESVVSLKFKTKPRRYKTDEYCVMKGVLMLNDDNVNDFIYLFKSTEEVKK